MLAATLSAVLTACSPSVPTGSLSAETASVSDTFPVRITGPQPWLRQLASAARQCGYPDAVVTTWPYGTKVVEIESAILPEDDSPTECVMRWITAHPNDEFGFIGNAARSP
jgi:hypothetical protein